MSLDEAYLDLSGTERIHGLSPGQDHGAGWRRASNSEIGITVSIGLSGNKFLAKLASELDKPRGFAVIGMAEAKSFPARQTGRDHARRRQGAAGETGTRRHRHHRRSCRTPIPKSSLSAMAQPAFGCHRMAHAPRIRAPWIPAGEMKTISSETTFDKDLSGYAELESVLWRQAERVSARAKANGLAGTTIVLKLKTARFPPSHPLASLDAPTQLADRIFRTAQAALKREANGTRFRLLGVGLSNLVPADSADPLQPDRSAIGQAGRGGTGNGQDPRQIRRRGGGHWPCVSQRTAGQNSRRAARR